MSRSEALFFGGSILTMEDAPAPEAVLVRDGKIAAAGPLAALTALAPGARRRDLEGCCLMPAFLDAHSHITALASTLGLCQLGAAGSFREIRTALQDYRAAHPQGWTVGFGYDHNVLDERAHPTRQVLDECMPGVPVLITHASGHMGVASTAALEAMGITADTPDPEGGRIGREADGRTPNGYLEETAFLRIRAALPAPSRADACKALAAAEQAYLSHGIVLAQEGLADQGRYDLLASARLTVDTVGYADLKHDPDLAERPGIGGYKIFLDGSPQGRTAWMLEPYARQEEGETDYRGYPVYSDDEVTGFLRTALKRRRQILAHCNGDAAAEQYLRCMERAAAETGVEAACIRSVMIHAQLVRREQLERMKRLGMIPSFFAAHLWYWGDVHTENFGARRAASISPLAWAAELGLPFTLHQDTPVIQPDMLESVWCAACRVTRRGAVLGPELRLSPREALKAVTIHAAYQYFMENERGSIAPGKRADLGILSGDPTAVEPLSIRQIWVLETIKDGTTVYAR